MSTIKQKNAAKKLVENRGMAISKIMVSPDVGYDETTAKNPKNLTESKGFKEELENYGLTQELVKTSLVDDIIAKPGKRFFELSLGADILGMKQKGDVYVDQRSVNLAISDEQLERLIERRNKRTSKDTNRS